MTAVKEVASMLEMLPKNEQQFACEVVRKLVLAWDVDFTKLTPKEAAELKIAQEQVKNGETFLNDDIDWDNLNAMNLE